jgi:FkbM family methyltransferase
LFREMMVQTDSQILNELDRHYFGPESDEQDVITQLPAVCGDCATFVDIGASLGQYTYFAAQAMQGGRVLALEADPFRYAALAKRVSDWSAETDTEIEVVHAAAADSIGECEFYVTDSTISGGMVHHPTSGNAPSWRKVVVPAITIDDVWMHRGLIKNSTRPEVVKIDVEGTELRVLQGAQELLGAGNARFLVEVHSWGDVERNHKPEDVFRFMKRFGYRATHLGRLHLFERRRPLFSRLAAKMLGR